jgi:hypothetical protein
MRTKFGQYQKQQKTDAMNSIFDRNNSLQNVLRGSNMTRKKSEQVIVAMRNEGSSSKQPKSRLKFYGDRNKRDSKESSNRNFLSFTMGKNDQFSSSGYDSNNVLRNSAELFNRKSSKRTNLLRSKYLGEKKSRKESDHNSKVPDTPDGLEKKLGRFKSLKNLINNAEPEKKSQKFKRKESGAQLLETETPTRISKILQSKKGSNKYQMKNSFQEIFKKKYSHQHNLVIDRTNNLKRQESLLRIKENSSPQNKTIQSIQDIVDKSDGTRARTRTDFNNKSNLDSLLLASKTIQDQSQDSKVTNNSILNHFNLTTNLNQSRATKDEATVILNESSMTNSKIMDQLLKSKTPDATLEASAYSMSQYSPQKRKRNRVLKTDQSGKKHENSLLSSSKK